MPPWRYPRCRDEGERPTARAGCLALGVLAACLALAPRGRRGRALRPRAAGRLRGGRGGAARRRCRRRCGRRRGACARTGSSRAACGGPQAASRSSVDGVRVRGAVEVDRVAGGLRVVNEVPLEAYVAGTVGREVYAFWSAETLKAQAVVTPHLRAARARAAGAAGLRRLRRDPGPGLRRRGRREPRRAGGHPGHARRVSRLAIAADPRGLPLGLGRADRERRGGVGARRPLPREPAGRERGGFAGHLLASFDLRHHTGARSGEARAPDRPGSRGPGRRANAERARAARRRCAAMAAIRSSERGNCAAPSERT